ncbi:MAG: hypothetical protein H8E29_12650 [Anaerolineales bacterium]|uniref:Sulfatase N-terminal domain-containing protein n=1 Tax=Candidatus Desulfolinea nitratireducens TaxID=2841698 RepID=A0A8J6NJY6_9CHLR|nr:hypothetical protein [Candidatus Desulfolinea nitratireducens]
MTRSGEYIFWITSALSLIYIAFLRLGKRKISFPLKSEEGFSTANLILLLLPLTPVSQYILNNLDILSPSESIYVFLIFTVFVAFFVLFIPAFFQRISSSQILMFFGLAFTFSIIYMGDLSHQLGWIEVGTLRKQLAIFTVVFLLSWFFFFSKNQKSLYTLVMIVFLSTSISQFLEVSSGFSTLLSPKDANKLLTLVNSRKPELTPSVYLLIYDSYVVNETMLSYGIDNQPQEKYLEELGFQIYPRTYSIAPQSVETMSRVLNASTEHYGDPRTAGTAGDGIVQNLLKEFGYKTYGIFPSDYFFQGTTSTYDYSFPGHTPITKNILVKAIFTGEFRFDIGFDEVSGEQFVEEKTNILSTKTSYPRFMYTHAFIPSHSQDSGKCRDNEIDLFNEKLIRANLEMKQDLKVLLENDPDAIIIIAGDHGPYLTKNCSHTGEDYDLSKISRYDIQDRYGTFLAIRWPTQDYEKYDDITVLQDLFPAIFAYIFQDQKLLESKIAPVTIRNGYYISETKVVDGIIEGGIHSGEPLFIGIDK